MTSLYLTVKLYMDEDYKLLVAAIDFGSTTAGYAFSFRHEYRKDPLDISTFLWTTGNHDIATSKAPCSVLLDLEKRFIAFGYEAEDKYEGILANNLQDDWYYFKGFKMLLYKAIENGEDIARDFKIDDVTGKSMSARRIFSIAIGYLRRHLLVQLRERNVGLHESEIWWTITVPSIWTEPAKEFMMQCAEKASLDRQKVSILFEPEAASIYCRLLPVDKFIGQNKVTSFKSFEAGRKYIVVDAGGGTVNISTQEVSHGEEIDMLYKVSGGPWGGDKINEEFIKLLCNVFGDDIIQQFRDFNGPDYLDLTRQFELKKKTYNRFLKNDIVMRLPFELCDLFETYTGRKIEDAICKSKYSEYP
ncbi:heat shock 70 kDa protein 12A-like [Mytilus californianus]|uniref:heat shock 70 kDa protein 12A-like n=1 Tax=Mytilus californianus TaxID=6549 RepID=UPI002246C960|nr:heat shock 70 kDa protein 12A-like [Mytilus californianus]